MLIDPYATETENVNGLSPTATVHPLSAYVSFVAFVRGLCMFLRPLVSVSVIPAAHFGFPSIVSVLPCVRSHLRFAFCLSALLI